MHVDYGTAVVGEELCTRGFLFCFFCVFFSFFFLFQRSFVVVQGCSVAGKAQE